MPDRPKLSLPFGSGLDRDTGSAVVPATSQEDLRNVHLTQGLAFLRNGSEVTATFIDPDDGGAIDVLVAGLALKVENAGVVVGYRSSTRKLHVYRVTRAGGSPSYLGLWGTIDASAVAPPIVWLAEVSGLLFMAHDEDSVTRRLPTAYYDPTAGALYPLGASWAHANTISPGGTNNTIRAWPVAALGTVITLEYVDPGGVTAAFSVTVAGSAITVHLARAASAVTTTANDVIAGLQASAPASALIAVAVDPGSDGTGLVSALAPVTIDAGDGIRFRGVTDHLGAYLAGWGYGTEAENRPDFVRLSLPDDPTTFRLQYYESIGQKGDSVLVCLTLGLSGLLCCKAEETWNHTGTDRSNFGKQQVDPTLGVLTGKLGIVIDDADGNGNALALIWSKLGPRVSNGGGLVDLAQPLAIDRPAPTDLSPEGDPSTAFAVYLPNRSEVRFHFGQRFYAYSLLNKKSPWSYGEMAVAPTCGFLLAGSGGANVEAGSAGSLMVTSDVEP